MTSGSHTSDAGDSTKKCFLESAACFQECFCSYLGVDLTTSHVLIGKVPGGRVTFGLPKGGRLLQQKKKGPQQINNCHPMVWWVRITSHRFNMPFNMCQFEFTLPRSLLQLFHGSSAAPAESLNL